MLKQIDAGVLNIAYQDEGDPDGKTVILLHGFPSSSWLYRNVMPALVREGYRTVAPDLLGYGSSTKPADSSLLDHDRQARRILGLMDSLGIERFSIVLHDIGGIWAWEMSTSRTLESSPVGPPGAAPPPSVSRTWMGRWDWALVTGTTTS